MSDKRLRIAVVGAGISGIAAALLLSEKHDVTLFEKRDRLGGHTHTITLDSGPDAGLAVDTGFIVCNDKTYPTFHRFLKRLGVRWRWSDMSFGYHDEESGLHYAGTSLNGLFAQRRNFANPSFIGMLLEIRRFCAQAVSDLNNPRIESETLAQYLRRHRFNRYFINNYLIPMGAAIWSTRSGKMMQFPAATLIRFFHNHGLLSIKDRPRWQTVVGGSHSYLTAFRRQFPGKIRLGASISTILREPQRVTIGFSDGAAEHFDHVVIGVHGNQVLGLLGDPSAEEQRLFGAWGYERNSVVLHTDVNVLPPSRRAWASWNYVREKGSGKDSRLSMTYYMNMLQGLKTPRHYCVTLNRNAPIREDRIIRELVYAHPLYTRESRGTQEPLRALSGRNRTSWCGAYFGYGFHEDGVKSGEAVAREFGLSLPM